MIDKGRILTMHHIKHITSGCLAFLLAANFLTGCGLPMKETPENTTDTMPLPTTTTFVAPTTTPTTTIIESTELIESEFTKETTMEETTKNDFSDTITNFLSQKDEDFIDCSQFITTAEHTYLVLYSIHLEENTYRLALANPETDMFEIILENTPLVLLHTIENENSFEILKAYDKIQLEGNDTFIPAPFEIVQYSRLDSSFIEKIAPATLTIEDPQFQDYTFGNDNFETAILTDLILEENTVRIRQTITKTASDKTSSLTHLIYDTQNNCFSLSMECHDTVDILPSIPENSYIQDIFLSTAEEGSTLEISLSSDWDKIYYIQEELISEEENSYIIDTILSFVPYIPEETIPSETETQVEVKE